MAFSNSFIIHQVFKTKLIMTVTVFGYLIFIKPGPNGLASERKFSNCVYLRLRLARACVHLRWPAITCAPFGRDQICTQGRPTQVSASWVTSINLSLANEIQDMSALKSFFLRLLFKLVRKLASPFGHPMQVSMQAQLVATCDYSCTCESVWPRL